MQDFENTEREWLEQNHGEELLNYLRGLHVAAVEEDDVGLAATAAWLTARVFAWGRQYEREIWNPPLDPPGGYQ